MAHAQRPRLYTATLVVSVTPQMHENLRSCAAAAGCSVADLVREALALSAELSPVLAAVARASADRDVSQAALVREAIEAYEREGWGLAATD